MKYVKILIGTVEQVYDFEGNCLEQRFVLNDLAPVERRAVREVSDGEQKPDQLEHDELIEHSDDVEYLLSKEKFCDTEMVQPHLLPKIPKATR